MVRISGDALSNDVEVVRIVDADGNPATVENEPGGRAKVTLPAAAGGSLTVTDGDTTVDPVTALSLSGATVSDEGGGVAGIAIPSPPGIEQVLTVENNANGQEIINLAALSFDDSEGGIDTAGGDVATGGGALNAGNGSLTCGDAGITGAINHDGAAVGFYGVAPAARPSITVGDAAEILAALVTLGLVSDDT